MSLTTSNCMKSQLSSVTLHPERTNILGLIENLRDSAVVVDFGERRTGIRRNALWLIHHLGPPSIVPYLYERFRASEAQPFFGTFAVLTVPLCSMSVDCFMWVDRLGHPWYAPHRPQHSRPNPTLTTAGFMATPNR